MTAVSDCAASLPPVPPSLAERGFGLRRETPEDKDFLVRLYISVRWEELERSGWTDQQKLDFLAQQFGFQDTHYARHYADAARGIVTDAGGQPVGRIYLYRMSSELRVVDVSMLPSHRSLGLGSALLRAAFEQSRELGLPVTIHVEIFNTNARRLYERLGFVEVPGGSDVHRKMEWRAA